MVERGDGKQEAETVAFRSEADELPPRMPDFGDFSDIEYIGHGGMGVVYRARKISLGKTVALKVSRSDVLAPTGEAARFRREAENMAALDHPNIVPVYEVGSHGGRSYLSMKLLTGGSLDQHIERYVGDTRAAVRLMLVLATAIRHAHRHGLLHRDLKPANVLLDEAGEPHVVDFGLARKAGTDSSLTQTGTVLGTASYIAPEQASGLAKQLTWAADVYSLGAILYELLTGAPPFRGETIIDTLQAVRKHEPVSPRLHDPTIDKDVETICLKCLAKAPEERYESARALANDLQRWLDGKPIAARPVSRPVRAWRWCRRHPRVSILSAVTSILLIVVTLVAVQSAAERRARRSQILADNVYVARLVAQLIQNRFEAWGESVTGVVPAAREHLERGDIGGLQALLENLCDQPHIENWHVFDRDGNMIARTPGRVHDGESFRVRDYFQGAVRHAGLDGRDALHVSKVYHSVIDDLYKFDITAPVVDADASLLGVIGVSVTTDPSLGLSQLQYAGHRVMVVAPGDPGHRDTDVHPLLPDALVLLHPAYAYGEEAVSIDRGALPEFGAACPGELAGSPPARHVADRDDAFRDPVVPEEEPWLAGFAPVGRTGFLVVVLQRDVDAADAPP